jgi:hypothetical protein
MESRHPPPDVRPPAPHLADVEDAAAARVETEPDEAWIGEPTDEDRRRAAPPPDTGTGTDPQETLRAFARPRLTGTAGADEVRRGVVRRLAKLGYETRELRFDFSAWPGRFALPVGGGGLALASLVGALLLGAGRPLGALILLVLGGVLAGAVALFALPMIERLPWGRIEGCNVLAHRPGERPRYIIMAHFDSKSQLVPLALRGPAVGVIIVAWLCLFVLALFALIEPLATTLVWVAGVAVLAAGVAIGLSFAGNESPGALDNATGLAALLAIAAREREHGDIGFLATDAEELGLAGARAIATRLPPSFGVLNIDALDDHGTFYIMERFGWKKHGIAPNMAAALLGAATELDERAARRDVPLGVLVDHIPIVQAGQPAMTLMRGSLRSLGRVHRPADSVAQLRGDGVARGVELVCRALAMLREDHEAQAGVAPRRPRE